MMQYNYTQGTDGFLLSREVTDSIVDSLPLLKWNNADDMAKNAKAPEFYINDILETASHGMVAGKSMAFKSFLALKLAHSICSGQDFFGHKVFKTGKVYYICGEGVQALSRRIKALDIDSGGFNGNLQVLDCSILLDSPVEMARLKSDVSIQNPVLVIMDTFSSLTGNTEESDNNSVANCLRLIKETCQGSNGKTSSLLVHHYGKSSDAGMRGASAFQANVDFEFSMERDADKKRMLTKLSCIKQKDSEMFSPITMVAEVVDLELVRQDETNATSLVLKSTDEQTTPKPDKSKHSEPILQLIKDNLTLPPDGIARPSENNSQQSVTKGISEKNLRELAYPILNVAPNSQRGTFNRAIKKLEDSSRILKIKDFIYLLDEP